MAYKCRADGFRELYSWLENRDLLVVTGSVRPWKSVVGSMPLRLDCVAFGAVNSARFYGSEVSGKPYPFRLVLLGRY